MLMDKYKEKTKLHLQGVYKYKSVQGYINTDKYYKDET